MDTSFMAPSNTLPLEACSLNSKVEEEIEDDELKSPYELLEAPPLLLMPEPISLKFGRKSHQPCEELLDGIAREGGLNRAFKETL